MLHFERLSALNVHSLSTWERRLTLDLHNLCTWGLVQAVCTLCCTLEGCLDEQSLSTWEWRLTLDLHNLCTWGLAQTVYTQCRPLTGCQPRVFYHFSTLCIKANLGYMLSSQQTMQTVYTGQTKAQGRPMNMLHFTCLQLKQFTQVVTQMSYQSCLLAWHSVRLHWMWRICHSRRPLVLVGLTALLLVSRSRGWMPEMVRFFAVLKDQIQGGKKTLKLKKILEATPWN